MSALRGMVVVFLGLAGIAIGVSALPRFRRATLGRRLVPYLGALGPRRSRLLETRAVRGGWWSTFDPMREALGEWLHRCFDDGLELGERLAAAGAAPDESAFRTRQVTWGLAGLAGGLAVGLLLVAGRSAAPVLAIGLAVVASFGGVLACDRDLTRRAERRRAEIRSALPTVVDLLCLAVTAGESLRTALGMTAEAVPGALGDELRAALRAARAGGALVEALEARARPIGLPELDRLVVSIAAAQERGLPLADVLRALAFDLREHERRSLIEVAGRKQVSMLVPVVMLILPVAIVFAFYPGVVAIRTLAR
jgi:tight adherence protein C